MQANWFIALPLPPTSLPPGELAQVPAGTRTFAPEDLHVTVAFLGAVGEQRALHAWSRLDTDAELPLQASIGARAVFGSPRRPSALGLDLDTAGSDGALTRFITAWRNTLREAAGLAPEQRPARPHVTLGRPPRRTDTSWKNALAAWLDRPPPDTLIRLERIALYTRAEPGGARRFREIRTLP